ncbi:MAG TPA: hypothetical protein VKA48_00325 [Gammaproteobacteria bacterium]|nr:hypothetical protein [Gammaproteobacteria bacterium]
MTEHTKDKLPQWVCHKTVRAAKIQEVSYTTNGGAFLIFEEDGVPMHRVTPDYVAKHNPLPGGYYVLYEDGYESWSPAGAFEGGYIRL